MKTLRRLRCTAPGAAACPTLIHQTPQERGACTRRHKVRSFSLKMTQSGKAAGAPAALSAGPSWGLPGPRPDLRTLCISIGPNGSTQPWSPRPALPSAASRSALNLSRRVFWLDGWSAHRPPCHLAARQPHLAPRVHRAPSSAGRSGTRTDGAYPGESARGGDSRGSGFAPTPDPGGCPIALPRMSREPLGAARDEATAE